MEERKNEGQHIAREKESSEEREGGRTRAQEVEHRGRRVMRTRAQWNAQTASDAPALQASALTETARDRACERGIHPRVGDTQTHRRIHTVRMKKEEELDGRPEGGREERKRTREIEERRRAGPSGVIARFSFRVDKASLLMDRSKQ